MRTQSASRPLSGFNPKNIASALTHAIEGLLNRIFAFNHDTATIRSMVVSVGFIVLWLVLAFTNLPRAEYSALMKSWLDVYKAGDTQQILITGLSVFATIFLNLVVVRHLLALYVPFWLAQQVAAIYLADIFEKEDKVAQTFIQQATFGGYYHSIHIRQGKVVKGHEDSPVIQIGGPGYAVVELDSAVVFESPDGTARVIGPTPNDWHGYALIQGFERIRQGIDLRDILQKQDVASRSIEGIPVTARDIQYSYSIYRGPNPVKSQRVPYPFDENAILSLVYATPRTVKLNETPVHKPDWLDPLPVKIMGQISSEMNSFINKRFLSDFLIAIDKPDDPGSLDTAADGKRADQAGLPGVRVVYDPAQTSASVGQSRASGQAEELKPSLDYVPRSMLTKIFYDSFQARAARGNTLNWIGVGTWDTPSQAQVILKNHREAWRVSRENFTRGNPAELQQLFNEARLREFPHLIEEVLIRKFFVDLQGQETEQQIRAVLQEYLGVLERSAEYFDPDIPESILVAIQEIKRWLHPS
jgi:hypothetical protein